MVEFTRQSLIYDPEAHNAQVIIVGAGSTGSFTAFTLAKMGINRIKVIDFDNVESHNIPNQYYRLKDIGKPKVEALQEIIKDFSDIEIEIENTEIKEGYDFKADLDTIIIFCVDSIEVRQLMTELIEDTPVQVIDTRFGGEGYSVHLFNAGEVDQVQAYKESLEGEIKPTTCGEKSIIYTINSLASEVCNIVKKIIRKEPYPVILRREMKTYKFIHRIE